MKVIVSNPKTGKSYQVEIEKEKEGQLIGRKIGDEVDGGVVNAPGYKLKITGGSDISGFPMRSDVSGPRRVDVLLSDQPGFRPEEKGERKRKSVRGDVISDQIVQVNTMVTEEGSKPLDELILQKKEEKK